MAEKEKKNEMKNKRCGDCSHANCRSAVITWRDSMADKILVNNFSSSVTALQLSADNLGQDGVGPSPCGGPLGGYLRRG